MTIKLILPLICLLFIGCNKICEDIPIMDADILIKHYTVEINKYTNGHKILIDYILINKGTTTIIGWDITFAVNFINGDITFVGHTANPFNRSTFKIEPRDTTELIKLRRDIPSSKVTDIQLYEIVLQ